VGSGRDQLGAFDDADAEAPMWRRCRRNGVVVGRNWLLLGSRRYPKRERAAAAEGRVDPSRFGPALHAGFERSATCRRRTADCVLMDCDRSALGS